MKLNEINPIEHHAHKMVIDYLRNNNRKWVAQRQMIRSNGVIDTIRHHIKLDPPVPDLYSLAHALDVMINSYHLDSGNKHSYLETLNRNRFEVGIRDIESDTWISMVTLRPDEIVIYYKGLKI